MRTSKVQYKWHILNLILFQPTVEERKRKKKGRKGEEKGKKKAFYVDVCCEWTALIVSQFFFMLLDYRKFLPYIYIPHLFAQWAIVTMNILQHDGCEVEQKDDVQLLGTLLARQLIY